MKNEKLKVGFKKIEFDFEIERHSVLMPALSEILAVYNSLGFAVLDDDGFKRLLKQPKEEIFTIVTDGKDISFAGLKMSSAKAFELLEMPDGVSDLLKKIEAVNQEVNFDYYLPSTVLLDGEIALNPVVIDKLTDSSTIYATTEAQKNAVKFIDGVLKLRDECFGERIIDITEFLSKSIRLPGFYEVKKEYSVDYSLAISLGDKN